MFQRRNEWFVSRALKKLNRLPGVVSLLSALHEQYGLSALLRPLIWKLMHLAIVQGDREGLSSASEDSDSEMTDGLVSYASTLRGILTEIALTEPMAKALAR